MVVIFSMPSHPEISYNAFHFILLKYPFKRFSNDLSFAYKFIEEYY